MCFFNLRDKYFSIECVVFPKIYEKINYLINNDNTVIIKGVLKKDSEEVKILVNDVISIEDEEKLNLYLCFKNFENMNLQFEKVKDLISLNKGKSRVFLYCYDEKKSFMINENYNVKLTNKFIFELNKIFSQKNVKIVIK